jgi:hypothetical protein
MAAEAGSQRGLRIYPRWPIIECGPMLTVDSNSGIALVMGFGAGLFLFFRGFRIFRKYRILADTPQMPIRSVAMGLVEVHGKAKGEHRIVSPVTRTPCFFYKVDIEKWIQDKNGGHWSQARTDAHGVPFYLDDGTGQVLVDAHGAEADLIRTARRETGRNLTLSLRRLFSSEERSPALASAFVSDSELLSYAESVVGTAASSIDSGEIVKTLFRGGLSLARGSSPRYRLSEHLILPEHWYDVTGTCTENPTAREGECRPMIKKGENEPTFLISWRSEKEIENTLRDRAVLHVLGGGVLAVASLAILLWKLGWL